VLKETVADLTLENRLPKKACQAPLAKCEHSPTGWQMGETRNEVSVSQKRIRHAAKAASRYSLKFDRM
jgi:hypothetical protein